MYQRRCTVWGGGYCVGLVPRFSFSSLGTRLDYRWTTADVPASMHCMGCRVLCWPHSKALILKPGNEARLPQDYCRRTSIDALHGVEGTVLACARLSCPIAVAAQVKIVTQEALVPFSIEVMSTTSITDAS